MSALTFSTVFMLVPLLHRYGQAEHGRVLDEAAAMVEQRGLRPLVDPTPWTLAQVGAAHEQIESGRAVGKIVLDIG